MFQTQINEALQLHVERAVFLGVFLSFSLTPPLMQQFGRRPLLLSPDAAGTLFYGEYK